jgi:large subunit ribosomal protein L18
MRKILKKIKSPSKLKEYRRKLSIRKKVSGSADIPRIAAIKTNKNIQIQVINDNNMTTMFAVQTFGKNAVAKGTNQEAAQKIGSAVAAGLKERKIEKAVFDRNGKQYTGVIAKIADSIRENGIQI